MLKNPIDINFVLGDPQWVARAQEFRTAPPPEEEADPSGAGGPVWIGGPGPADNS